MNVSPSEAAYVLSFVDPACGLAGAVLCGLLGDVALKRGYAHANVTVCYALMVACCLCVDSPVKSCLLS